jgi:uncharacterized protein (TIGR02611 family)
MQRQAKRGLVAIVGSIVVILGIIMIPYPGPGWLVVFAGLGILSTEYEKPKRLLQFARGKYDAWNNWMNQQKFAVRAFFWLLTTVIVVGTLYLLNTYGSINDILGLNQSWMQSPFVR